MLEGSHGKQRKEVANLVDWLESDFRPDVVLLTNVLLSGLVPELKRRLNVPVVATVQGDDIFLDSLPAPVRQRAVELIRDNCRGVAGLIATCRYYADFMAEYLGLERECFQVVYPGLKHSPFLPPEAAVGRPPIIGYFARICAGERPPSARRRFYPVAEIARAPPARLHFSGWLGDHNKPYLAGIRRKLANAGLSNDVEHIEAPTHADKLRFLSSVDVLSVPAPYREPKGLYVLEALAQSVPVVQPRHGSFPELIERTGGGLLVNPDDPADLANGLRRLLDDAVLRHELGRKGQSVVREYFTAERIARDTHDVLRGFV